MAYTKSTQTPAPDSQKRGGRERHASAYCGLRGDARVHEWLPAEPRRGSSCTEHTSAIRRASYATNKSETTLTYIDGGDDRDRRPERLNHCESRIRGGSLLRQEDEKRTLLLDSIAPVRILTYRDRGQKVEAS